MRNIHIVLEKRDGSSIVIPVDDGLSRRNDALDAFEHARRDVNVVSAVAFLGDNDIRAFRRS